MSSKPNRSESTGPQSIPTPAIPEVIWCHDGISPDESACRKPPQKASGLGGCCVAY
jgi:hypothetical protein